MDTIYDNKGFIVSTFFDEVRQYCYHTDFQADEMGGYRPSFTTDKTKAEPVELYREACQLGEWLMINDFEVVVIQVVEDEEDA